MQEYVVDFDSEYLAVDGAVAGQLFAVDFNLDIACMG